MFRVTAHRLGQVVGHTKCFIGQVDRGIRTGRRVFNAVKEVVPDGKIKRAAEKGFSDYEVLREKVRSGGY